MYEKPFCTTSHTLSNKNEKRKKSETITQTFVHITHIHPKERAKLKEEMMHQIICRNI